MKEADEAALFICTAGLVIGEMSRNSMKGGDLLKGYVYDVIGSEVVEAAADRMQEELRKSMAAPRERITNRFSPGYCGWDVAEQHQLFSFFKDNFCGITLTESALMNPVKSVSGVIGIGKMSGLHHINVSSARTRTVSIGRKVIGSEGLRFKVWRSCGHAILQLCNLAFMQS